MINGNDFDLEKHSGSLSVQKRAVPVEVRFAGSDGICITKEGDVSYKAGDAIMTGVEGEQWPIERAKFDATYEPIAPTNAGEDGSYSKKPTTVYALQMNELFYVDVSWGAGRLEGEPGDWLLQYGPGDYGVVSKSIFEKTYDILNVEGLGG